MSHINLITKGFERSKGQGSNPTFTYTSGRSAPDPRSSSQLTVDPHFGDQPTPDPHSSDERAPKRRRLNDQEPSGKQDLGLPTTTLANRIRGITRAQRKDKKAEKSIVPLTRSGSFSDDMSDPTPSPPPPVAFRSSTSNKSSTVSGNNGTNNNPRRGSTATSKATTHQRTTSAASASASTTTRVSGTHGHKGVAVLSARKTTAFTSLPSASHSRTASLANSLVLSQSGGKGTMVNGAGARSDDDDDDDDDEEEEDEEEDGSQSGSELSSPPSEGEGQPKRDITEEHLDLNDEANEEENEEGEEDEGEDDEKVNNEDEDDNEEDENPFAARLPPRHGRTASGGASPGIPPRATRQSSLRSASAAGRTGRGVIPAGMWEWAKKKNSKKTKNNKSDEDDEDGNDEDEDDNEEDENPFAARLPPRHGRTASGGAGPGIPPPRATRQSSLRSASAAGRTGRGVIPAGMWEWAKKKNSKKTKNNKSDEDDEDGSEGEEGDDDEEDEDGGAGAHEGRPADSRDESLVHPAENAADEDEPMLNGTTNQHSPNGTFNSDDDVTTQHLPIPTVKIEPPPSATVPSFRPQEATASGQHASVPLPSSQLNDGIYTITNVHHLRFVYLEDANDYTPLRGHHRPGICTAQWRVRYYGNGQYSIENVDHNRYADSGYRAVVKTLVESNSKERLWRIQALPTGEYMIATTDTGNLWMLPDDEPDTPVELFNVPTDRRCWWNFKKQEIESPANENLMAPPILSEPELLLALAQSPAIPGDMDLDILESEPYLAQRFGVHVPNLSGQVRMLDKGTVFSGTYSTVYPGMYGDKKVAIKVLRAVKEGEKIERKFRRELFIWWNLRHVNVLPLYGYFEGKEGGHFPSLISKRCVSEYRQWAERGSAAQYINRDLRWDQRTNLFYDVAKGLNYLHGLEALIIHADLKPQNVVVNNDGVGQLCDFGLTRFMQDGLETGLTTTAAHTGTVRYLAYELVDYEDKPIPTAATDMYALGCLGLEFIYRILPHASLRTNHGKIMRAIGDGVPPAKRPANPEEVVPILWDLVEACWIYAPEERPTATQVSDYLEKNLDALSESLEQCSWTPEHPTR